MSQPLTSLIADRHRFLRGLLFGIDPALDHVDRDSSPLLVVVHMVQHGVHEELVLLPLFEAVPSDPDRAGGARAVSDSVSALERVLTDFERQSVGSPEYVQAYARLIREFEEHASRLEAELVPRVDEHVDPAVVDDLRDLLGPVAAERARLPEPVRESLADPAWPRPGLAQQVRRAFEAQLADRQPKTADR